MNRWRRWGAAWRYVAVEVLAGFVSLALLIVTLLLAVPLLFGAIWQALPALRVLGRWTGAARLRAGRHLGIKLPADLTTDLSGEVGAAEIRRVLFAKETRLQLVWLLLSALLATSVGAILAVLPFAATNAVAVLGYWQTFPADQPVQQVVSVTSWPLAVASAAIGLAYAALSWWLTPPAARWSAQATAGLLTPSRSDQLSRRVETLTASRAAALDAHASELRRIERDLHDGAQNRLVGVVMMLGLARRALEQDPARAAELMDRADEAARDALGNLRTTVHDLHPPILDELGLEGALSSLAGRSVIPCELTVHPLPRMALAVESAAYFVVAEALTNVAKHSEATECTVTVDLLDDGTPRVRAVIEDNGRGDIVERSDGGLAGIRRRVEAFEGVVRVHSPAGGPSTITVELPCAW